MKTINFICVNFNNFFYTQKLIESLQRQVGFNKEFYLSCTVVDNSTDKEDSHRLENYCSSIKWSNYIRSSSNLGYFGGLNLGLEYAKTDDFDFIIICNNDLEFDKMFCANLIKIKSYSNVFAICPDIITPKQEHQNPHLKTRMPTLGKIKLDFYFFSYRIAKALTFIKNNFNLNKKYKYTEESCEIHMGIGACYILTKTFFRYFEKLDYPFFLYGEEAFFSEQIHSKNGVLMYEPSLKVNHAESATLATLPKKIPYNFAKEGYSTYRKLL